MSKLPSWQVVLPMGRTIRDGRAPFGRHCFAAWRMESELCNSWKGRQSPFPPNEKAPFCGMSIQLRLMMTTMFLPPRPAAPPSIQASRGINFSFPIHNRHTTSRAGLDTPVAIRAKRLDSGGLRDWIRQINRR